MLRGGGVVFVLGLAAGEANIREKGYRGWRNVRPKRIEGGGQGGKSKGWVSLAGWESEAGKG